MNHANTFPQMARNYHYSSKQRYIKFVPCHVHLQYFVALIHSNHNVNAEYITTAILNVKSLMQNRD